MATFAGGVRTGCGAATSRVGPFSCAADTTVHLDLGVLDQLAPRGLRDG